MRTELLMKKRHIEKNEFVGVVTTKLLRDSQTYDNLKSTISHGI